ncbi:hypothetical protein ACIBL3_24315 [Kribbella sp. NPDC050124]|uniref:hypothetical protein n=1 Tax=Kribbella sp. NPDC050124 TaxID=3364114 RepID=UPI0037BD054C
MAALAHEHMYAYVANTGRFHDNNALRNDYYMERWFSYTEIGPAEARRLIDEGAIGRLDDDSEALERWRADPRPLKPADVLAIAAGVNP